MILRIITAPVNRGKSTSLRRMLMEAVDADLSVGGFLTIPEWEEEGKRKKGFFLEFPGDSSFSATGDSPVQVRIAGEEKGEGCVKVGRFYLYPEGIRCGFEAVKKSLQRNITIIDEIGPAELEGQGHWEALQLALQREEGEVWISLRLHLLEEFLSLVHALSSPPELLISQPLFHGQP